MIENYPHYRSLAFADDDEDNDEDKQQEPRNFDGDYQRVVIDQDGIVHSKHLKYNRLR